MPGDQEIHAASSVANPGCRRFAFHPMSIYRRTLAYYRPHLAQSAGATLLNLASIGLGLMKPWPFAAMVGIVLPAALSGSKTVILWGFEMPLASAPVLLCGSLVLAHLAAGWLQWLSSLLYIKIGLTALLRLRTELYAYLHSLPLKFHDTRRSSDSSFRVAYDSQSIHTFYSKATFIFGALITIGSTFAAIWVLDWQIALLSLSVVPLLFGAIRLYAKRIRIQSTDIQERESAVLTHIQEGLSSVKMVQAFGREDFEIDQFKGHARESLAANLRQTDTSMRSFLVVSTLIAASSAAMLYVGFHHVAAGALKLDALIAINTYLVMLYQPLEGLANLAWALEGASAAAQRCFEILDRPDDVPDAPDATELAGAKGLIQMEAVSFGYSSEHPIFRDVNLQIQPGETVAFVGGTGAGKSTLLSLIPRFYDPTGGRVLLDGRDIRSVTKKSLRQQMSIVLQDTLLFSTTIRENIAYGRPDATEEEIIEAARRAQAHEFISAMPNGYASQVGERGSHLSVGQRQRIGIARAFLKNAPILLLDEPTSALDPATEAAIMETIHELMRGRTTLIITHRIATIHHLAKIVVLGPGGLLEQGSGPELLARGGPYARLCHAAGVATAAPSL
ncbi:MAG: ABC-type multidrug transport system, ATPase and permease component [Verrucomicrobiota bacterium]